MQNPTSPPALQKPYNQHTKLAYNKSNIKAQIQHLFSNWVYTKLLSPSIHQNHYLQEKRSNTNNTRKRPSNLDVGSSARELRRRRAVSPGAGRLSSTHGGGEGSADAACRHGGDGRAGGVGGWGSNGKRGGRAGDVGAGGEGPGGSVLESAVWDGVVWDRTYSVTVTVTGAEQISSL